MLDTYAREFERATRAEDVLTKLEATGLGRVIAGGPSTGGE
jgi:hypothetical protein